MGKYSIENQAAAKKLAVTVEGTFQPLDAQSFIAAFGKEAKMIAPPQYDLVFDCGKLDVSSQQMVPILQGCMELYKKLCFKKVSIHTFGNVILKMQLQKVIASVNMPNATLA